MSDQTVATRRSEWLDRFKASEDPMSAMVLRGNDAAQLVIVAWPNVSLDWATDGVGLTGSLMGSARPATAWEWLWQGLSLDMGELQALVGVNSYAVASAFSLVQGNRLIYPDGTTSEPAKKALLGAWPKPEEE